MFSFVEGVLKHNAVCDVCPIKALAAYFYIKCFYMRTISALRTTGLVARFTYVGTVIALASIRVAVPKCVTPKYFGVLYSECNCFARCNELECFGVVNTERKRVGCSMLNLNVLVCGIMNARDLLALCQSLLFWCGY